MALAAASGATTLARRTLTEANPGGWPAPGAPLPWRSVVTQPLRRALAEPFLFLAWSRRFRPHGFPILTYHSVSSTAGTDVETVHPQAFERQMEWLQRHAIEGVTVSDLLERMSSGKAARPAVGLTFDDGYLDNHATVLPILKAFGMRATFYIVAGYVGGVSGWNAPGYIGHRPMLGRSEIADLVAAGMEIGSHSMGHADLTQLGMDRLDEDLLRSREALKKMTGRPVIGLAAPFGRRNGAVASRAALAGYRHLVGGGRFTANGRGTPPYDLRRITIARGDSLREFAKKASGAYGWLSFRERA